MPKAARTNRDAVAFGAVIQRLRKERRWTIRKLSQRCGLNPTHLGVLEKGGNIPSLTTLLELAEVLGIPAADIVAEVEQARRPARARAVTRERSVE